MVDEEQPEIPIAPDGDERDGQEAPSFIKRQLTCSVITTDGESFVKNYTKLPLTGKLKSVFDTFDIDQNGQISLEEVCSMARTLRIDMPQDKVIEIMREADTNGDGEVDFDEFIQAARSTDFAELVTSASFPADVYKILEEVNARFLGTFQDFVMEIVSGCESEVLAAKVPLSSYGRVHSALEEVKSLLTVTAQEHLAVEFAQLRIGTLECLKAQKDDIEARHKTRHQIAVESIQSDAKSRIAAAEQMQAAAVAESERLKARFEQPEVLMSKLEKELSMANDEITTLKARMSTMQSDWKDAYPRALARSTATPPPLPSDTPFIIQELEQHGMTVQQFLKPLNQNGLVSKQELRKAMQQLSLLPPNHSNGKGEAKTSLSESEEPTAQLFDLFLNDTSVKAATNINVQELTEMLCDWKGPPAGPVTQARSEARKRQKPQRDNGSALKCALDRLFDADAHGSRLLYLVELYEEALKASEQSLAEQQRQAKLRATADSQSAELKGATRAREWEAEREAMGGKHADEMLVLERLLEEEKNARQAAMTEVRESASASNAEAIKSERKAATLLREKLEAKGEECKALSEKLGSTTAELTAELQSCRAELQATKDTLQATNEAKAESSFKVKETRQEYQEGILEFEARLRRAHAALLKAEAAQPTQGGYFCAAAPTRARSPTVLHSSFHKHSTPTSPSESIGTPTAPSEPSTTLFDKYKRRSESNSLIERAQRLCALGVSPPRAATLSTPYSLAEEHSPAHLVRVTSKRKSRQRRGKGKTADLH